LQGFTHLRESQEESGRHEKKYKRGHKQRERESEREGARRGNVECWGGERETIERRGDVWERREREGGI